MKKMDEEIREKCDEFKKSGKADQEEAEESEKEDEDNSSEESSDDSDSESENSNSDDSDDDSSADSEVWDNSENEEVVIDEQARLALNRAERRKFWLKKVDDTKPEVDETTKKPVQKRTATVAFKEVDFEKQIKTYTVQLDFQRTEYEINKRLVEICSRRGKNDMNTNLDDIKVQNYCFGEAKDLTDQKQLELIIVLLNIRNETTETAYMDRQMWLDSLANQKIFLDIIIKNEVVLKEKVANYLKDEELKYNKVELMNLIKSNLINLNEQWNIAVRMLEQNDMEFDLRLRDETGLLVLMKDSIEYFKTEQNQKIVGDISFRFLEHIYHHSDNMVKKIRQRVENYIVPENSQAYIRELAANIYNSSPADKYISKTGLYEAYNYALNDEYVKSKDLMQMSKIPETNNASEGTILMVYNRALVQLGICAFRKGMIHEAKEILDEIFTQSRVKEMLGQTMPRVNGKEDRRKLFPYHLHISFEMIESIYLMCVMLIEIPQIVSGDKEMDKKNVNKLLQKLWNFYEKNDYNGPPENHKEFIYAAQKQLAQGDWKQCFAYLGSLKMWSRICNAEQIKKNILEIVKKQAYKSFIFAMKGSSHTLRFEHLQDIFELSMEKLCSITCKMIRSKELKARLDYQTNSLIIGQNDLTYLEKLANNVASKIAVVSNINEKLFDAKYVGVGFQDNSGNADLIQNKKNKRNYIMGGKNTKKKGRTNH